VNILQNGTLFAPLDISPLCDTIDNAVKVTSIHTQLHLKLRSSHKCHIFTKNKWWYLTGDLMIKGPTNSWICTLHWRRFKRSSGELIRYKSSSHRLLFHWYIAILRSDLSLNRGISFKKISTRQKTDRKRRTSFSSTIKHKLLSARFHFSTIRR